MPNIFKCMKPDKVCRTVNDIDLEELKGRGIRLFLLDFDNTLGPDHAHRPVEFSFQAVDRIRQAGFDCCLVSNAKSGRSAGIAKELEMQCITYAHKPNPSGVYRALKMMDADASEAVMVGDQVFTDVIAGKMAGVYTIMVERFSKKEIWYVRLKRPLEKIVRLFARY